MSEKLIYNYLIQDMRYKAMVNTDKELVKINSKVATLIRTYRRQGRFVGRCIEEEENKLKY